MSELTLNNIFKMYGHKKGKKINEADYAVNNLSLKCKDGDFIGILGPSGCGKTTTLRMIAGLEDITSGEIMIADKVVNDVKPKDRGIGLAFEDYALYPPLNVYDNVAFCLKAKNMTKEFIEDEIRRIAPLLKIEDILTERVSNLSGGQKQRVNIARAIVRRPSILLLDEPLSHLDGKMRQILRTEIKRLQNDIKCTTIIVTHDQLEAMSLSDKIAIMNEGVLQQYGTPNEVFNKPANEFVAGFIGEPQMNLFTVNVRKINNSLYFIFEDEKTKIPVPEKFYECIDSDQVVRLGIRPSDITIEYDKNKGVSMEVDVCENLGDEFRVVFTIGKSLLSMTTTKETKCTSGDVLNVNMNGNKLHIFDYKTKKRIRGNN